MDFPDLDYKSVFRWLRTDIFSNSPEEFSELIRQSLIGNADALINSIDVNIDKKNENDVDKKNRAAGLLKDIHKLCVRKELNIMRIVIKLRSINTSIATDSISFYKLKTPYRRLFDKMRKRMLIDKGISTGFSRSQIKRKEESNALWLDGELDALLDCIASKTDASEYTKLREMMLAPLKRILDEMIATDNDPHFSELYQNYMLLQIVESPNNVDRGSAINEMIQYIKDMLQYKKMSANTDKRMVSDNSTTDALDWNADNTNMSTETECFNIFKFDFLNKQETYYLISQKVDDIIEYYLGDKTSLLQTLGFTFQEILTLIDKQKMLDELERDFVKYLEQADKISHKKVPIIESFGLLIAQRTISSLYIHSLLDTKECNEKILTDIYAITLYQIYRDLVVSYTINIHPSTIVGSYFLMGSKNIFINKHTVIGNNCSIGNDVFIDSGLDNHAILLNDNVTISNNTMLIGNISIGRNVKVDSGRIINFSISDVI